MQLPNESAESLTVYNLSEALAYLHIHTGRVWTDSLLFDFLVQRRFIIHAAAPITSQVMNRVVNKWCDEEYEYVPVVRHYRPGEICLGMIGPSEIEQLWHVGETRMTSAFFGEVDAKDEELEARADFTEPIRVDRASIRFKHGLMETIVKTWVSNQYPTATSVVTLIAANRPIARSDSQERAIILELKNQGYDPLALPKNPPGKPGSKAAVYKVLSTDPLFTKSIFNKAWVRLTDQASIVIKR
jgi:hypothetical protein